MSAVPYLRVYKDGQLIDNICLRGRDLWIAGRHADCDIWVGHASTSRRHLEIQILYVRRELLLIDLRSVHGTRVNGQAVKHSCPYVVKQGDIVQIGASTRSYKVDWAPVSVIEHMSEAAASISERSSPNGSKATCRYKITSRQQEGNGDNRKSIYGQDENAPSPVGIRGQKAGRPELPPRTRVRRLPFANVQASTVNISPRQGSTLRKAVTLPEKRSPSKIAPVVEETQLNLSTQIQEDGTEGSTTSTLWLRRCSSAPLPTLLTNTDEALPVPNQETSAEVSDVLRNLVMYSSDEYSSDKENNYSVHNERRSLSDGRSYGESTRKEQKIRKPFTELPIFSKWTKPVFSPTTVSSPDSDYGKRTLGLPPPQRRETSELVNRLNSQFSNLKLIAKGSCQWYVIIDTNCLIEEEALGSLKRLQGIHEIQLIIPQIVLRELDGLKRRHDVGYSARGALKWIETSMQNSPSWMTVQRIPDTLPILPTPPSNDDYILECAFWFHRTSTDGRVALLTQDIALRIKAMAEGLVVDGATPFVDSLLSPYSERFLYLGSTPFLPAATSFRHQRFAAYEESYALQPVSPIIDSSSEIYSKNKFHFNDQPQGLQVVLA